MTTDGPASSVRHTDPKTRFLAAALISFSVAFATGIPAAVAAVLLSLVLIALFRPNGKELKKRLLAANAFILFLWVFTPFTTPGTPVWSIGPLEATDAGVRLSLLVTLKCNAIIASLFSLTAGLTLSESAMALQKLGLPPKLVMLLLFTGRYIESFSQEYKRLRDAARLRGFAPKTTLFTYRVYATLMGQLFVRAFARAERTGEAMRLRGFDGVNLRCLEWAGTSDARQNLALISFAVLEIAILASLMILRPF